MAIGRPRASSPTGMDYAEDQTFDIEKTVIKSPSSVPDRPV